MHICMQSYTAFGIKYEYQGLLKIFLKSLLLKIEEALFPR
jgi:hypothetical protein